ncbi:cell division protein ZapA [Ructibacterium gallinarum]|uniref:Cell division protein ZapA n=1 Tax=Ructibacterium gallinarum TaxID=2779355 RepID=A0A9D5M1N4_9FIRM|nr:cell division protein ZapA [Ructibacterium gallinarum]MBE5039773.1 cell division protein ZapA [Ructibacterium gallinarum]
MENKKVEVKINNVEYTLLTNESEEYVQRVALLVNKRMAQIQEGNKQLSTAMTAVLTSINIADELLKNEGVLDNIRLELKRYMEEAQRSGEELEAKKLEVEKLKEDMHKLQIELAKKETELSSVRRRQG